MEKEALVDVMLTLASWGSGGQEVNPFAMCQLDLVLNTVRFSLKYIFSDVGRPKKD